MKNIRFALYSVFLCAGAFALDSQFSIVQRKAKAASHSKYERSKLMDAKHQLNKIARGFIQAEKPGKEFYRVAGITLMDIAYGLPEDTTKLDLLMAEVDKGKMSSDLYSADYLVKVNLKSIFSY